MTEHIQPTTRPQTKEVSRPNWSAVFSVAFCVACLITVEFLPVSLLTPMAQDLGISEGVAGQSVTVTAFVAMFASLFITQVIGTIDRRKVVILFSVLLTLSCLLVSFAESFTLLLLGRACLGLVLLSFGIASFVGTSLSSQFLKRSLKVALAGAPLVLAASATVLVLWGSDKWVASAIAIIWGFAFALVPVGWSTWITRSLADQAEKAGSIQVAVIQLANTCGAAIGGVALDHLGLTSPLVISGTLMLLTALLVAGKVKAK
ncbi:TPA: MFS transporter [Enterobacter roggenkampii]